MTVVGGEERRFLAERVAEIHLQFSDRRPLGDRRHDRPVIDDAGRQLFRVGDRHENVDRPLRLQRKRRGRPAVDAGVADDGAIGEKRLPLEGAHAPFEQLARLLRPLALALHAAHRGIEPAAVLLHRRDDGVARIVGEAGLQPVDADVQADQRVAVALADVVPGEGVLAEIVVEVRIGVMDVARQLGQFPHRHLRLGIRQAGRIVEGGLRQADLPGALGHHAGEIRLRAGHALGDRDAGIVRRLHDDALDQVLEADRRVDLGEHGRTARHGAAVAPGVLRNLERVVEMQVAGLDCVKDDLERHQLRQRGGRNELVRVLGEQDRAGLAVHQHGLLRAGLEELGPCRGSAEQRQNARRQDHDARRTKPHHSNSHHSPSRCL